MQREIDWRDGKRLARLLEADKLKVSSAFVASDPRRPWTSLPRCPIAHSASHHLVD